MILQVLDLFSGIGGFSLGLEAAGMRTVAFCEIDPYCRRVLARHWPEVPCYEDIRTLTHQRLATDGIAVDVMCGGFPCQDISVAGSGAGLTGERSGLWFEYLRLIGEIRPTWVIIENVSIFRSRGLDVVLGGLSEIRYDAEWHCIPASALGAPHRRDRIWIVAYSAGERFQGEYSLLWSEASGRDTPCLPEASWGGPFMANANGEHVEGIHWKGQQQGNTARSSDGSPWAILRSIEAKDWLPEPAICRVVDGVPARVDRLRCLGNAVVPVIPEAIGRAIVIRHACRIMA